MKPILDALVAVVILAIVINLLVGLIAPYAIYLVAAIFVAVVGGYALRRYRQF